LNHRSSKTDFAIRILW